MELNREESKRLFIEYSHTTESFGTMGPVILAALLAVATAQNVFASSWTDQSLCVLKSGPTCPAGFQEQPLRLSIQPDVNPKDKNYRGEDLMILGDAGDSNLVYDEYDRLYTLTMVTCCK